MSEDSNENTVYKMPTCRGCRHPFQANQQGHMGPGGCLEEPSASADSESGETTIEIGENEFPQYKCGDCFISVYSPYAHTLSCLMVQKCPYCRYYLDGRYGQPHRWGCQEIASDVNEQEYYLFWRKMLENRRKLEREYLDGVYQFFHK